MKRRNFFQTILGAAATAKAAPKPALVRTTHSRIATTTLSSLYSWNYPEHYDDYLRLNHLPPHERPSRIYPKP